jgi:CRISPR-associated protein Csx10
MRLYYTLSTIDPVILSQNNTTTNNHECLDYIPGSALLGLFAAQHYQHLSEEQAWQAFHSGACRFSPCYPFIDGQISLPTPACWHYGKGEQVSVSKLNLQHDLQNNEQHYNVASISNHCAPDFVRDASKQYVQCRDGYLNNKGQLALVKQGLSTKTAIDRATGKASNSKLFSYSYIEAGQSFAGWIECDNEALLNTLKTTLNSIQRIGRSRNVEFGRVKLTLSELLPASAPVQSSKLVLWCLSDCEFINEHGMPTLTPGGTDIHCDLNEVRLNTAKSFIRSNKVSRFNQKRQGYDSEQVLISKGSVLVFESKKTIPAEVFSKISEKGVGINQQQGLGWVQVNPQWTRSAKLESETLFTGITLKSQIEKSVHVEPSSNSVLLAWVKEHVAQDSANAKTSAEVSTCLASIFDFYRNARNYNNIINSNEAGPSASQWRRIADKVRSANMEWTKGVFVGEQAICKASNDELGWGITWHNGQRQSDFADATQQLLAAKSVAFMRLLLEKLCRFDISTHKGLKDFAREYHLADYKADQSLDNNPAQGPQKELSL